MKSCNLKTWSTSSGITIHRLLFGRCNSYLVIAGGNSVLVDTGIRLVAGKLIRNLQSTLPEGKKLSYLLLTHTHFDHCRNAAMLKETQGCRILVSEKEKEFAEKGYTDIPNGTNLLSKKISTEGRKIGSRKFGYPPFLTDIAVADRYDFQGELPGLEVISTPGHSSGSLSLLVDREIAIVGDAMIHVFRNNVYPPFADDVCDLERSWEKLLSTGCSTFLPGHGKPVSRKLLENSLRKYSITTRK